MAIAKQVQAAIESQDSGHYDSDSDPGSPVPVEGRGKDATNEPGKKQFDVPIDPKPSSPKTDAGGSNGSKRQQSMSGQKKRKRKHPLYGRSRRSLAATKADRSRWGSAWRLKPDGTTKGYLSYTTKIYLVSSLAYASPVTDKVTLFIRAVWLTIWILP